ncbi:MAG: type II toxin-antitoxin system prevent-host-death family antitoxin [Acidimicrobiales bacterium]
MLVNIQEAGLHLSELVERAAAGEEIILAKAGRPMARRVAYDGERRPRVPGALKGRIRISEDFDQTPAWLVDAFEVDLLRC